MNRLGSSPLSIARSAWFCSLVLLGAACATDDPTGTFAAAFPDRHAAVEAEPVATDPPIVLTTSAPIVIPDDALDLTGAVEAGIDIEDNVFIQSVVVIKAGTTVTWTNNGRNEHNVQPAEEEAFTPISASNLSEKGDSAAVTFSTSGDFPYFCSLHGTPNRGQTGRIIVLP